MFYRIELHQSSGETQFEAESESWEQIQKDWEEAKQSDDYSEMDEEITLRQSTDDWKTNDEMIDCYIIPESQRNF